MTEPVSDSAGVIAPPPVMYIATLLLGCIMQVAVPSDLFPPFAGFRLVGAGLFLVSAVFARWAFLAMRRVGTSADPKTPTTKLSMAGPFRITRNPIYVAMTGLYLGVAVTIDSVWVLLLLVPLLGLMQWGVILREERYLSTRFGKAYQAYQRRVPRWLLFR